VHNSITGFKFNIIFYGTTGVVLGISPPPHVSTNDNA
jgi:hypothetical protein